MKHDKQPVTAARHLDLKALALSGGDVAGFEALSKYERLMQETRGLGGDLLVNWAAHGEMRPGASGQDQVWLSLTASASLPLVCQRCMAPVDVALSVDRQFRFVADEKTAETEDDESEEDVLVLTREFDLQALVEDELLMELPLIPRHETCPQPVKLEVLDADFDAATPEKPNPFAVLAKMQISKPR
jgi:uncharacterized protein